MAQFFVFRKNIKVFSELAILGLKNDTFVCVFPKKIMIICLCFVSLHNFFLEYSDPLERLIRLVQRDEESDMGLAEDEAIRNEFCIGSPVAKEGNETSSFCYLLIDPSKILDSQHCSFKEFISAIFYVGKGKRSRPLQHLHDALKRRQKPNSFSNIQVS